MALSQGAIKRNRKANKEAKLKKYREAKNKNKVKKPMPFGLMGITKKMGIKKSSIPRDAEQQALYEGTIKKHGGVVKRKAGGAIGVGKALRGWGKGYK